MTNKLRDEAERLSKEILTGHYLETAYEKEIVLKKITTALLAFKGEDEYQKYRKELLEHADKLEAENKTLRRHYETVLGNYRESERKLADYEREKK